jgi:hypothetical protein
LRKSTDFEEVVNLKRLGLGAGGLLTLPIKVFNFNGDGLVPATLRYIWAFWGWLWALMGIYLRFMVVNTKRA